MKKLKLFLSLALLCVGIAASAHAPKYVFYFIGDGMGMGHIQGAQNYNRIVLGNSEPLLMMQFPIASMAMTYSASSHVTDSAAAGTALSTGHKTNNGMLGVTPDTVAVTSVAKQLRDMGYGVGILTTVTPDDATPGAFYAHVPARSMYEDIDKAAAASGYQFIAGSKLRTLKEGGELAKTLADSNVTIVRGIEGMKDVATERVILLNPEHLTSGNAGYTIDSIPGALTLPDMTQACLDHLKKYTPEKFFMMVEGGNIDYAAHSNDGGAVVKEILNFNKALAIAYDFYLQHPDETLIVVTADHNTGGFANGFPHKGYSGGLKNINYQRISKDSFADLSKSIMKSRRIFTWDDMKELLSEKLGFFTHIQIPEDAEKALHEKFDITFKDRNSKDVKTLYKDFNEFTVEVFKVMDASTGIDWTTTGHTGDPVPVFAIGIGADRFKKISNNIEIPARLRAITGIE